MCVVGFHPFYRPHRLSRGIALLYHDRGTRRGWVVSSTPRPHFTPGKDPVPIVQEAGGGPQGRSGRAENLVPTGIRFRTVQPVVSRYTDWATRPTWRRSTEINIKHRRYYARDLIWDTENYARDLTWHTATRLTTLQNTSLYECFTVCSVNHKSKFWYIFGLLSSKYTAVISIGSSPSLRYSLRIPTWCRNSV